MGSHEKKRTREDLDSSSEIVDLSSGNKGEGKEEKRKMSDIRELKDMMKNMIDMQNSLKTEITALRKDLKTKEEEWQREKTEMNSRIEILEREMEFREREKKRNNIVIKGLKIHENVKVETEKFIQKNVKVDVKPINTYKIVTKKQDSIVAQFENLESKITVMKNKKNLKTNKERIYIEDDFTKKE